MSYPRSSANRVAMPSVQFWLPASMQRPLGHSGNAWAIAGDDRPNDPDWTREERVRWMNVLVRLPASARTGTEAALQEAIRRQHEEVLPILDDPAEREELLRERLRLVPAPGGFSSRAKSPSSTLQSTPAFPK